MAYVRANNEANECIIENYQVLKLEKYVLETQELDARKTENEFRNRNKKLKAEVTLKRKHHAEASSHYALCIAQVFYKDLVKEVLKALNVSKMLIIISVGWIRKATQGM